MRICRKRIDTPQQKSPMLGLQHGGFYNEIYGVQTQYISCQGYIFSVSFRRILRKLSSFTELDMKE